MNQKFIKINNEVNKLLRNGLELALLMEEMGRKDLADFVIAETSKTAKERIDASGLQLELRKFWNDKYALSQNTN
jgi:hypothetical protein